MKPLRKVMLVDDEILALRHIRNMIPWEDHGYEIVGEYSNPQKALDNLSRLKPDVVIADIKMPIMDGLALSRKLLATHPQLKIILLTSYKEFDYAKEALKLGIFDYWVKHEVNAPFLAAELARLKQEIETEEKHYHLLRLQAWTSLLQGEPLTSGQEAQLSSVLQGNDANLSVMLLGIDRAMPGIGRRQELPSLSVEDIRGFIRTAAFDSSLQVLEVMRLAEDRWCLIIQTQYLPSQLKSWEQLRELAVYLQLKVREASGATLSIAASNRFVAATDLPELYRNVLRLLDCGAWFFGRGKLLSLEGHGSDMKEVELPYRRMEPELKAAVEAGDDDLVTSIVQQALETAKQALDANALYKLHEAMIGWLDEIRDNHGLPSWRERRQDSDRDPIYTAEQWRDWMLDVWHATIHQLQAEQVFSRKVRQTMEYIRKHYAEDITIESMAEEVGISGEHLRHLFKEETGRTLHDYLTHIRVERAKQLLLEGSYKIYEVAEMVGYSSGQYFSQVFRKSTGMGPLEYAESKGKLKS